MSSVEGTDRTALDPIAPSTGGSFGAPRTTPVGHNRFTHGSVPSIHPESVLDLASRAPMDPRVPAWLAIKVLCRDILALLPREEVPMAPEPESEQLRLFDPDTMEPFPDGNDTDPRIGQDPESD